MRIQIQASLLQRWYPRFRRVKVASSRRPKLRRLGFQELGERLPLAADDDFYGIPTANDDEYLVSHDQVLSVSAPGVLANDTDPTGQTLAAAIVVLPLHGSASLSSNGALTYTPQAAYVGPDQFTYRVTDTDGNQSGLATVTIAVGPGIVISDASVGEGGIAGFTVNLTVAPLSGQQSP